MRQSCKEREPQKQKLLTAKIAKQSRKVRREILNFLSSDPPINTDNYLISNPWKSVLIRGNEVYEATGAAGAFAAKPKILPTRSDTWAPLERQ
jgi:hypothetical protein